MRKLANPTRLLTQREGQVAKNHRKILQDSVMEQKKGREVQSDACGEKVSWLHTQNSAQHHLEILTAQHSIAPQENPNPNAP